MALGAHGPLVWPKIVPSKGVGEHKSTQEGLKVVLYPVL
jgi:hypothetical protein